MGIESGQNDTLYQKILSVESYSVNSKLVSYK